MSRRYILWVALFLLISLIVFVGVTDLKMPGADEKVGGIAERYAKEVGAGKREPFINTDKGDLLLFVFALGGAIAGFWLGYNWRDLFGWPAVSKSESGKLKSSSEKGGI